ncbi:hypothetical protein BGZ80_006542, partial [Entomortierella chlamydospora]
LSTNPLRILDSKSPQDIQILENCPSLLDYLSESSRERFSFVAETLAYLKIPFTVNPRLVRGLDYYQDTVFEFKASSSPLLGSQQGTVLAGGRYDGLVEKMGGPSGIPSIGWAAGLERLSLLVNDQVIPVKKRVVAVIPVPDREAPPSRTASTAIGASDGSTEALSQLGKQLIKATKRNASYAVLVGTNELSKGTVVLKDLEKAEQKHCRVDELVQELQRSGTR